MEGDGHGGDVYTDPWHEYKAISAKLRRRLLRKPNLAEASRNFERLSHRLQQEEASFHYAGLCKLGVARCEHSASNVAGETGGLVSAGQLFLRAEKEKQDLSLPSMEDNLNVAIHCFGHAIRVHMEQHEPEMAAALSLEIALACVGFSKHSQAVPYLEKAAFLFKENPLCRIHALKWLVMCYLRLGSFVKAMSNIELLDSLAISVTADCTPSGFYRNLLRDCEILYLFCCLQERILQSDGTCTNHVPEGRLKTAVEGFAQPSVCPSRRVTSLKSGSGENPASLSGRVKTVSLSSDSQPSMLLPVKDLASQSRLHRYISEDDYLLLQSFVLAILDGVESWQDADWNLKQLWPHLDDMQRDLASELVQRTANEPGGEGADV